MYRQRIESALKTCDEHINSLDPNDLRNKELESYIVAGLVVLVVSEYEEHIESLFVRRAEKCGDVFAVNYIRTMLSQKFRSPDLSKISDTLKRFDSNLKVDFLKLVQDTPKHAAWDTLLKARHAVVHKKGDLKLTFKELKEKYTLTLDLIQNIESTLGL